jgi:hypothetical protein
VPAAVLDAVLSRQQVPIQAILAALPAAPIIVRTPGLSGLLYGPQKKDAISHELIAMYLATLHVLEAQPDPDGPSLRAVVKRILQKEQEAVFAQHAFDPPRFLLEYLRAYERAIFKHLHLSKVGTTPEVLSADPDRVTCHVLRMTPKDAATFEVDKLMTSEVFPDKRSKCLDDIRVSITALQDELGLNTLV